MDAVVFGLAVRGLARQRNDDPAEVASLLLPPPIDAAVEVYEALHAIEFRTLRRHDMGVESGRLHLVRPRHGTDLRQFVDGGQALDTANDVKRRVATRLAWRARPSTLGLADGTPAPSDAWRLIAGFDLHRLDPDLLPADFTPAGMEKDPARYAQAIGRVTLMPSFMQGLSADGFGDLGRIEAAYPSESLRIEAAGLGDPRAAAGASPPRAMVLRGRVGGDLSQADAAALAVSRARTKP
ncbi:MAG: hypothetical protein QM742_07675 [Aquabacterium sp.]